MFSRRVSSNSAASWDTTEMSPRKSARLRSLVLIPSIVTDPPIGSTSRVSTLKTVDFPAPDAPTSAVVFPAAAVKFAPRRTGRSPYVKVTLSRLTIGAAVVGDTGLAGEISVGRSLRTSCSRSMLAAAICHCPDIKPNRRSGSNASDIAVKNDMNCPTVFSPATISAPPKMSTPKKPTPVIISINAGTAA